MITVMITHEVDDVDHWLSSPKRDEFFSARGMSARTFVNPEGSNLVGVIVETPDMEALEAAMETEEAAAAMKHDGVRPDTITMFLES